MKTIETLRFAEIEFNGTTQHVYNGKMFTASDKISGYGSGKKTVGTFVVDGTRYENIAIDRLRTILEGSKTTTTRTHKASKVTAGYCFDKLREFFAEAGADCKGIDKLEKTLADAIEKQKRDEEIAKACEVLGISVDQYKQIKGIK